jgi:hypothetical protein
MGKTTEIAWTDATFNPWSTVVMRVVALVAERDAVAYLKAQFRKVCERLDVVCSKVAASTIAALLTGIFVAHEHIEAPAFVLHRKTLVPALGKVAVFEAMASLATWRAFTSNLTDFRAGFKRMLDAFASRYIAWVLLPLLPACSHLLSSLISHRRAFAHGHS